MAIDTYTSDKIRVIGLLLTLIIVLHHATNLQFGDPGAWWFSAQAAFHHGLRALTVPLFFVLSAFFLCAKPDFAAAWPGEVRKRSGTLLAPFLAWSALWLVVFWAIQWSPALAARMGRDAISLADPAQVARLLFIDIIPHPLWYLRDLFVLTLLAPAIVWLLRRNWGMAVWFTGATAMLYSAPSFEVREIGDCFFFGIGAVLALHRPRLATPPAWARATLYVVVTAMLAGNCWWVHRYQVESIPLLHTAAVLGVPMVWLGYDDARRWLHRPALIRASSLAILLYVAHEPLVTIVRKMLLTATGTSPTALGLVWLATTGIVIGLIAGAAWVAGRIWPGALALFTGGRSRAKTAPVAAQAA